MTWTDRFPLGARVTFDHDNTYAAPQGKTLKGIVVGYEMTLLGNKTGVRVWSGDAEMEYGLPFAFVAPHNLYADIRARVMNLRQADIQKVQSLSRYPVWARRFEKEPDFTFYGISIRLLEAEMGAPEFYASDVVALANDHGDELWTGIVRHVGRNALYTVEWTERGGLEPLTKRYFAHNLVLVERPD